MKTYIAQNGDRLDTIIKNTYKTLDKQVVKNVIEANSHLVTKPILSDDDIVYLPIVELQKETQEVKTLW